MLQAALMHDVVASPNWISERFCSAEFPVLIQQTLLAYLHGSLDCAFSKWGQIERHIAVREK